MPEKLLARSVDPRPAGGRRSPTAAGFLAIALLLHPDVGTAAQDEAPSEAVSYSRAPQEVVVSYLEELGLLVDEDPGPSLKVYGDGRVEVHYPAYMKRAGDYRLRLSDSEMGALLRSLVRSGLLASSAHQPEVRLQPRRLQDRGHAKTSTDRARRAWQRCRTG